MRRINLFSNSYKNVLVSFRLTLQWTTVYYVYDLDKLCIVLKGDHIPLKFDSSRE